MDKTRLISTKLFTFLLLLTLIIVGACSFTRFIFAKSYIYHVEMPCDATTEKCYTRNCKDYCPPNGFSEYKIYEINASDFKYCLNNTCSNICATTSKCTEIECQTENGDSCKQ